MDKGLSKREARAAATLRAPLQGLVVPLDQVPDPAFAGGLVGDGIAIDPLDRALCAPCDGTVVQLHPSGHAVTLQGPGGLEVLLHIGIDTVTLRGRGFTPRVSQGDVVRAGQTLIEFDPDYIAEHARSLLTEVIVTGGGTPRPLATGRIALGEPLLAVAPAQDAPAGAPAPHATAGAGAWVESGPIALKLPAGLHARPAAAVASVARTFQSELELRCNGRRASARSVVALMRLEVGGDDRVTVAARGPDAAEAGAALEAALRALDETAQPAAPAAAPPVAGPERASADPRALAGVPAAPGVALGRVLQLRFTGPSFDERPAGAAEEERRALDRAIEAARRELATLRTRLSRQADPHQAAIFAAHGELLDDPELIARAEEQLAAGRGAARAWVSAYEEVAGQLAHLKSPLLAQRAADLRDVGQRVLRILAGGALTAPALPEETIAVAEALTPSELTALDRSKLRGLCLVGDGATSHVAILARALGIPLVAAIDGRALSLADGTVAIIDGDRGLLRPEPDDEQCAAVRAEQAERTRRSEAERADAQMPAVTRDGHRIQVAANLGSAAEASQAVSQGAEGVGLLRSEFLFLDRNTPPSEEEQVAVYGEILRALGPERPLILRTLDVGGDKTAPYLPVAPEANPFLGERGIRLTLAHPELLRAQLRAAVRAAAHGTLAIMFPMIGFLEELRQAVAMLREEEARLGAPRTQVGIMVEVPSAALIAERLAPEVDFFSIGTNDLTQYALAIDRGHPTLSSWADALHPAVLHLIAMTAAAARSHGKWVGVCGALASDPAAVPLLVGLGVTELSASVPAVAAVKAAVRRCELARCQQLAERALAAGSAAEVHALCVRED